MLRILYGEKGTGKTKKLIDEANNRLESAKGSIVFIDDDKSNSREISYQIRFVDASEYNIDSPKMFYGFICGLAAQDFDMEAIYIDAFAKIVRYDLASLEELFTSLERFSTKFDVDLTISINGTEANAPAFIQQYRV